jgi:hypothetical protein
MNIEQVKNTEEFWSAIVESSVRKGYGKISMPVKGMSEAAAINLAIKLNVSLLVRGSDYLFSTSEDGTLVQLGKEITRHQR